MNKKIIIYSVIFCMVMFLFCIFVFVANNSNVVVNNRDLFSMGELEVSETYKLNGKGFFGSQKILKEEYNEKGDIIYLQYEGSDNQSYNMSFDYEYDSNGRVTKIINNSYQNEFYYEYIILNYDDNGRIIRVEYTLKNNEYIENNVKINRNIMRYIYEFNYENDFYVVNGYMTLCKYKNEGSYQNSNNPFFTTNEKDEVESKKISVLNDYYFFEKEIDGKKYTLMIKLDSDENIIEKTIFENKTKKEETILKQLGLIPICYYTVEDYNFIPYENSLIVYSPENQMGNNVYKALSENNNIYDNMGRILEEDYGYEIMYSKYEEIDSNNYYRYTLHEKTNGKYLSTYKYTTNEIGDIKEIVYYEDKKISENEYNNLREEYISYINENKQETNININFEKELNYTVDELKSKISQDFLNFSLIGDDVVYTDTTYPDYCYRTYPSKKSPGGYTRVEGWVKDVDYTPNYDSGFIVGKGYYYNGKSTKYGYDINTYILKPGVNDIKYAYTIDENNYFKDISLTFNAPKPLIKLQWNEDKSILNIKTNNDNYETVPAEYFEIKVNGNIINADINDYWNYTPNLNETEFNVIVKNEYGIENSATISR